MYVCLLVPVELPDLGFPWLSRAKSMGRRRLSGKIYSCLA